MRRVCTLALAIPLAFSVLASGASAVTVGQTDDFEDGTTQGWLVSLLGMGVHPAPPMNVPGGGPAGALDSYLALTAVGGASAGSRLTAINVTQWTGDYASAGVTFIEIDLLNLGPTDLSIRLFLENPMGGPPVDTAVTDAVLLPVGQGWVHVSFAVSASDLTVLTGDVDTLLANVTALRIFHSPNAEFPGPAIVTQLGIDDVTALPEPSGALLIIAALAALAAQPRARRRLRR
ncbi:MAG TPA: hypothetical protein VFT98_08785 [Myxococcota bacterium]|nr:hypothetical protein [Myxococcota bacterium]